MVRREKQSGIADDSEIATIASNTIGLRFDLSDKRTIVIFCIFDHETLLVFYANVALQKTKRLSCAVIDSAQNNLQELYETLESQAI